jgi:hypothetical protein
MVYVRTIWRAFQENLEILECRPCSVSITETATPARSGGA